MPALTEYVQRMVKLDKEIFTVSHTAEDWEGLCKYIAGSNMEHKQQILDVLESNGFRPKIVRTTL